MRTLAYGLMVTRAINTSNTSLSLLWSPFDTVALTLSSELPGICFLCKLIVGANKATDSEGAVAREVR